jgi:arginyl-tRNA synthetase
MQDSIEPESDFSIQQVAEQVAQGAIKYSFLRSNIGRDIEFSFEESLSFEGNSGPYLQYTHARCQSVLRKAESDALMPGHSVDQYIPTELESSILRWMAKFAEIIDEASLKLSPNLVCAYLYELAQRYNSFYNSVPILQVDSLIERSYRLMITRAVANQINHGLFILGIETPHRM